MKTTTGLHFAFASTLGLLGLGLLSAGCSGSGGSGGGGSARRLLPARITRPAAVGSLTTVHAPATPAGSAVTALTPIGSDVLAALSAVGRVDRVPPSGPALHEATLPFDVTGFAAVASDDPIAHLADLGRDLLCGTGSPHALLGGGLHRRDAATGAWTLARPGARGTCVVGVARPLGAPAMAWAISGDATGAAAEVALLDSGAWVDGGALEGLDPRVATDHRALLWVGGAASTADGRARLFRGGMWGGPTRWDEVPVPLAPAQGEALAVVGLAEADGVLFVAVAGQDAVTGAPTRGALYAVDDAGPRLEQVAELGGDAPACLAPADGTVYVGTRGGRVLWLDAEGALRAEAGLPANRGVRALLAHDGALFIGVEGLSGAVLLRRGPAGGPGPGAPVLASITPRFGEAGATIELDGSFPPDAEVRLGAELLVITDRTPTRLTGTVPAGSRGRADVVVDSPTRGQTTSVAGFFRGTPTFEQDLHQALMNRCASCHGQLWGSPNLVTAYDAAVDRTTPALPLQSPLIVKGTGGGSPTHNGGAPLGTTTSDTVKTLVDWMAAGRPRS